MQTRRARVLALAFPLALLLAGCGSGSDSAPQSTVTPSTAEHGSLAHCLHEHGIDESAVSPVGPPAGVDQAAWDAAMQACNTLAPGPAGP